jgi:hypothetical protein
VVSYHPDPAAAAPRSPTARAPQPRREEPQPGRTPRAGTLLRRHGASAERVSERDAANERLGNISRRPSSGRSLDPLESPVNNSGRLAPVSTAAPTLIPSDILNGRGDQMRERVGTRICREVFQTPLRLNGFTQHVFPANPVKPTRGFEPRTPSLRVYGLLAAESAHLQATPASGHRMPLSPTPQYSTPLQGCVPTVFQSFELYQESTGVIALAHSMSPPPANRGRARSQRSVRRDAIQFQNGSHAVLRAFRVAEQPCLPSEAVDLSEVGDRAFAF